MLIDFRQIKMSSLIYLTNRSSHCSELTNKSITQLDEGEHRTSVLSPVRQ